MTSVNPVQKNLISFFTAALVFLFSISVNYAQCEGTYFKPTVRTLTDSLTFVDTFQQPRLAADLTGDGKLDLVTTAHPTYGSNKIFIYPGNGAGGFGARTEINLPGNLTQYFLEDFNLDNKTDLIVVYSYKVQVYLNNGNGALTPLAQTLLNGAGFNNEQAVNFADLNNDRRLDVITTNATPKYFRLANADGSFGASVSLPEAPGNYSYSFMYEGDFDGDGDADFAEPNFNGANALVILFNQGNGTFAVSNPLVSLDSGVFLKAVTDLNNDGRPDALYTGGTNIPKINVVLNQGNNNFTKTTYNVPSFVAAERAQLGDFNGDGLTDLISPVDTLLNPERGYFVSLNNGGGAFTQRYYPFGLGDLYARAVGDFNGDGKTDIIRVTNAEFSPRPLQSNIFNETQITVLASVCENFGQTKIVDFNQDGRSDLSLWGTSNGLWRYQYRINYAAVGVNTFLWGAPNDKPVPGDYDGDRATDYAVFRPSNGVWLVRNSSNNSTTSVQFGTDADKPVPADYNGDGRTDIAVYRPANGTWYILTSGTNEFSARQFGVAEDKPVPEDYDGDERSDLAVFRPSQGVWYILRSSNNSFSAVSWGLGSDDPHPADYDGDGKADITVRRKSNNVWYILRSYNNQFGALQFGLAEDIAQPGDWDGNGVMDIGVYRQSNRSWYATSTLFLGMFGEPGEIPAGSIQR